MRYLSLLACGVLLVGLTACGGDSGGSTDGADSQTVESNGVRLELPTAVTAGSPFEVTWEGPANPDDYISIAEKGTDDNAYADRTFTGNGSPLTVRVPDNPGAYEVRYVMAQSDRVIACKPLAVLPLQARLRAPDSVATGTGLEVSWIGPNGPDDFIAVATPEAAATDYESRALSRAGTPASVFAPSTPGTYELRYVWAEEDSVLTATPLTVSQE